MSVILKSRFEHGFAAAVAATSTGVVLSDPNQPDNPLIYANPAFLELTGYAEDEVLGRSCRFLQGPETSPDAVAAIRSALDARRGVQLRLKNYRRNGEMFWNELIVNPVFGDDGRLLKFVGIQKDVTAEVTLQRELAGRIDDLDAKNRALHAAQEELRHLAYYDALTGLASRRLFYDRLDQSLARCRRSGAMLAVMVMDLDGFKAINDRHGHEAGDAALRAAADRMKSEIRASDTLARLGGDEFVLLMDTDVTVEAAAQARERLQATFDEPFKVKGFALRLGASIGVAVHPLHGQDADALVRCADASMYAIKRTQAFQSRKPDALIY